MSCGPCAAIFSETGGLAGIIGARQTDVRRLATQHHTPGILGCLALAWAVCSAVSGETPTAPDSGSEAPAERSFQSGALPNGFRYSILPSATEPGHISLRLIVHVGSLDEHEDERGYAHFVEHMAFNGTRHYPPGQLVPFFQRHGIAWGADANATTFFTYTIYKLDLPAGHSAELGEALQILSDYAGGMDFVAAEVRRERNVILSEISARNTIQYQIWRDESAALYAGTLLAARLPVGDPDLVKRATSQSLRAFYQRCYRPERMELVAAGDVAPQSLIKWIDHEFGPLQGVGPGGPAVAAGSLIAHGPTAQVENNTLGNDEPNLALVSVVPFSSNRVESIEQNLGAGVVIDLLNRRLAARRAATAPKFGTADAQLRPGIDRRYTEYILQASAAKNDWVSAMDLLETELRRARERGFNASEVGESAAAALANLRSQADRFAGAQPDRVADQVSTELAAGRQWMDPSTAVAIANPYLGQFTPELAEAALRSIFPDPRIHLELTTNRPPPGGGQALKAAYEASAAKPLSAAESEISEDLQFRYADFGSTGAVAMRRAEPDLGLDLVRFANGVDLNLRTSKAEPHHFHLAARIGRGAADVPRDNSGIYLLGAALWSRCDLGRHTREEVKRLLNLHAITATGTLNDDELGVEFSGPSSELPFALQILTATMADAKFDASKMHQAISSYSEMTSQMLSSASGIAKVDGMYHMAGEDNRFRIPSPSEIARCSFDEVAAWLHARILEGPIEIGVVGDFGTESAIAAAASSVGTLAARGERTLAESERIHLRARPWRNVVPVAMPDQSAAVRLLWPIKDGADVNVLRALQIGAAALEDRLRVTLRQELGVTYAPQSNVYRNNEQSDFSLLSVDLTFPPKQAVKFAERAVHLADDLARHGMSQEEFARAIEPLRSSVKDSLRSNDWWLSSVLLFAQSRPAVLDETRSLGTAFETITLSDANRAIAAHLGIANASVVGVIPQAAPPAPAEKKAGAQSSPR